MATSGRQKRTFKLAQPFHNGPPQRQGEQARGGPTKVLENSVARSGRSAMLVALAL
jgi:hypothetical protein